MIYNFRHDKERTDDVSARIRDDKEISQGWGGGGEACLNLRQEDFIDETVNYHKLRTTRIPSNLTRMRDFKDGDLLIMPHLPEYGKVSIHIVNGNFPSCYRYDKTDDTCQNHRIAINDSIGLNGEFSIYGTELLEYRASLRSLQLPVLPIPYFFEIFSNIIEANRSNQSYRIDKSEMEDFLNDIYKEIKNVVTKKLRNMPASGRDISFEGICERLLRINGYEIESRNQYDRQGGDVDLRCRRSRSDTFVFESGEVTLFVQIKKHEENTDEYAVNQVLKMLEKESSADGCVMSMADGFTDEAIRLAKDHGIVLLNSDEICRLLMPHLSQRSSAI